MDTVKTINTFFVHFVIDYTITVNYIIVINKKNPSGYCQRKQNEEMMKGELETKDSLA